MYRRILANLAVILSLGTMSASQAANVSTQALDMATLGSPAGPGTTLSIKYDFFVGGLKLGNIDLSAAWTDQSYTVRSDIRTDGLAETLFQGRYKINSHGEMDGKRVAPRQFVIDTKTVEDEQFVDLKFDGRMPTELEAIPAYSFPYPVPDALKQETVDPLSAFMYLIMGSSIAPEAPCGQALPIFDGKRRYDFKVKHVKNISIRSGKTHGYRGPGYLCTLQYTRLAGFKPRKKGATPFPVVKAQLARIEDGKYLVPVRLTIETEFGAIVGTATEVRFGQSSQG